MNGLSHFVWQICLACILASVVRLLFPSGRMKPVINVALTLYIVTAVLPIKGEPLDWNWLEFSEMQSTQEQDYQTYAEQLYLESVRESLVLELERVGISATLEISPSGNCMIQVSQEQWEQTQEILRQAGWQGGIIQEEAKE